MNQVDSPTAAAIDFCSLSSTLVPKRTSQMIRYALQSERLGPLPLVNHADFAERVERSGFVFIGPRPESIRLMGDKVSPSTDCSMRIEAHCSPRWW